MEGEKERSDHRTNDLDFKEVGSQDIAFRDAISWNGVGLHSCAALVHGGELTPHALGYHSLLSADVVFNGILPPELPQEIFYLGSAEQIVNSTE